MGWLQQQQAVRQPLLPRISSSSGDGSGRRNAAGSRWQRLSLVSLTLAAAVLLAVLSLLGVWNVLLVSYQPPASPPQTLSSSIPASSSSSNSIPASSSSSSGSSAFGPLFSPQHTAAGTPAPAPVLNPFSSRRMRPRLARLSRAQQQQQHQQEPIKPLHLFGSMPHVYSLPPHDNSQRCQNTGICDGDYTCGPDGLGCVTLAKQRQEHVRKAISWSWEGYRFW
jgi:hypothetical protein